MEGRPVLVCLCLAYPLSAAPFLVWPLKKRIAVSRPARRPGAARTPLPSNCRQRPQIKPIQASHIPELWFNSLGQTVGHSTATKVVLLDIFDEPPTSLWFAPPPITFQCPRLGSVDTWASKETKHVSASARWTICVSSSLAV
ncbi:hypothetical protein EJ05DRAFT_64576 [Pseudovirgaria hyperparasitica]|uniref:Secreted protein n=1 Tax=Pseudovirgaria hyperparasitica TaxID=470096 RepID=A0A6A6W0H8_9PEZI|nr:uncharacterized protein EJ05DRAFT_64576 [Pseudovirgaria hyperparasitica]KAF2756412.1 hypothetical protein EJ05DRAFT_64576 [Pseudovirgaria hyperparasitica]